MSWQRWISISLVLGMLLLAFGLIMPAVFQAREAARRSSAKNNLKQIGLALHNYHDTHHCLPPGGTGCVYEIVIDGAAFEPVQQAMKSGLHTVCQQPGILQITAGNYGGKLGKHHFHLKDLIDRP